MPYFPHAETATHLFCHTSNGFLTFFFCGTRIRKGSAHNLIAFFSIFFILKMLLWPTRRSIFLRNCAVAHRKLLYLFSWFSWFSRNVLVAPVALRIRCLQKPSKLRMCLKTYRKPTILHHFFERILCDRLRFSRSRLGAFASRSWDLVGSSVSRGCFERVCFNELGVQRSEWNFDFGALRVFLLDFEIRCGLGSPGVVSDRFVVAT